MEGILVVLGVIVASSIYAIWNDQREMRAEKDAMYQQLYNSMEAKQTCESEVTDTKNLAYGILKEIGCAPEETENGNIRFEYQGADFLIEANEECLFVNVILPWCYHFSIFDVDEFARVRKVINELILRGTCQVFYTKNEESDEVAVHIKKNLILVPQIPLLDEYLKSILSSFFSAHRFLITELDRARVREYEHAERRG